MTFDVNRFRVKFRGRLNQPHTEWRGEEDEPHKNKQTREKKEEEKENQLEICPLKVINHKSALLSPMCGKDAGLGGGEKKSICVRTQTGDPISATKP